MASILVVVACTAHEEAEEELHASVSVESIVVEPRAFTETIDATGTVEVRAGHFAALSAPAPTRVTAVSTAVGEHVRKGASLVTLERAVFEAAATSAQAAVTSAQQAFDRAERLVQAGIAPRKDLDQASADLSVARSNLVAARRAVDLAVLRSPIDGVVTRLDAPLGAAVDAGQVLVEIADPQAIDVVLQVTPADAARIRIGASVALGSQGEGDEEAAMNGRVADIAGVVDTATRSVAVRVRPIGATHGMRIGESVPAVITKAVHANAIVVPIEALVPEGDAFHVFVVDSDSVVHARPVTVGARRGKEAMITDGLEAGERVVTSGAYGIDEGTKVLPPKP
jgi:cobalt-zinc-cadmium efflux system membrane fusion protein